MTTTEATATTDLDTFRTLVRAKAEEYLNTGYGNVESWNRMLVTCGLDPIMRTTIRVKASMPVDFGADVTVPPGRTAEQWIERQGGLKSIVDWYGAAATAWNDTVPEYEVVDGAPGVEGVEPDPNASTEDLRTYKRLVRREGLKLQREHDWCSSGTNSVFGEVGIGTVYGVTREATVTVSRRVTVTIKDAADEQDLEDMLDAGQLDLARVARESDVVGYRETFVSLELDAE